MSDHTWMDDGDERCFICFEDVSDCECSDEEIEAYFDEVSRQYFGFDPEAYRRTEGGV